MIKDIDGSAVTGTSSRTQPVYDPATGDSDKNVVLASTADVDTAVAAARAAWPAWSKTPALRRARVLDRFKSILWERADELAGIMPDADLDMTANALMGAAYGSAGERCMAISVVVPVSDAVADTLIEKLIPKINALKIGPTSESDSDMGPLVTAQHRDKVSGYIDAGEAEGATVVVDGRADRQDKQGYEDGYYNGGTLLDNVTPEMSVWKDEIFSPVLSVVRCNSYQEALDLVHSNDFANGTAIFTRDGETGRAFSQDVEVGMIGINVPIPVPMAFHSFGGWKSSR